jgi:uncharacterized membrane protein YccC
MIQLATATPIRLDRDGVEHAVRTATGAILSLLIARLFSLPESYWAAVTTIMVLQSTLGAALSVSAVRFIGTAMGAAAGAFVPALFGPNVVVFGATVFLLGVLSAVLHLDRCAFHFAGMTLAFVMLTVSGQSSWIVAAHRFLEVSIGIVISLLLTAVWHERVAELGMSAAGVETTSRRR